MFKKLPVLLLLLLGLAGRADAAWVGDKAPGFGLKKINSNDTVTLQSLKGKVVLIDFWASWCGPCKKELPALNEFYSKIDREKVEIIAINLDKKSENAVKFLKKTPVTFPILLDSESDIVKKFGGRAMPTSFIIDQNGVIRFVHLGFDEQDPLKWSEEINTLLGKQQ